MKKLLLIILISFLTMSTILPQEKHKLTVEDLWAMKRLNSFDISPNGEKIVFDFTQYEMEKNSGQSDIWIMNADGTDTSPEELRNK